MVEDGILTFRSVNLVCGLMLLIVMGIYAVHLAGGKEEEAE